MEDNSSLLIYDLLQQCREDYVGLWWIIAQVHAADLAGPDIRATVLRLVEQLLCHEEIVAGQFHDRQFVDWSLSVNDTIAKIRRDWAALGKEPGLGDVVWLTNRQFAKTHLPM